jgi:hypothetical protein
VKIQHEERLAATSELNPTPGLVTDRCEAGGKGYQAAMEVKVISPEILMILEADVICVTEGSNHTTDIKHLQSWEIAESYEIQRGDVSPTGSKTAAWYQMEMATELLRSYRETCLQMDKQTKPEEKLQLGSVS